MFNFNNPHLWAPDHYQTGPHHPPPLSAPAGVFPYAGGPGKEHPSGAGHAQGAQGPWVEQGQLQQLSQGSTHLQHGTKDNRKCYRLQTFIDKVSILWSDPILNIDYVNLILVHNVS